ncbi:hypothetical protein B0H15DRAFT_951156 [Mycena belliarum]|uniref:Uncharacterized protein n=1 Tax=Mycena belliarum TaxID=1033014 RepID=A0AAD6U1X7_9AGAR|nr:hypothetical protein B0H15DRAFT_951156 [Mycena belliae]
MPQASSSATSAHAARHPGRMVQQARGRKKGQPLSDIQKAKRSAADVERAIKDEELAADIDEFYAFRAQTMVDLAAKHGRSVDYIRTLLTNSSQYKQTREISLRNAVIHDIAVKAKEDGETHHITELHKLADAVLAEGVSPEDEASMIQALRDAREQRRMGIRASNVAAATDTRATAARIQEELTALFERTGTRGFAFVSRGHSDDANMPTFAQSGDALAFCVEIFERPALEILQLFELWSCTRKQENIARDTRKSLCHDIAALIESKLRDLVKDKMVKMEYVNYDVNICERWGVSIEGYPPDIDFVCPAKIKQIEILRGLRDGWRRGAIRWVKMSEDEVADLADALAQHRAKNGGVVKKRNRRSDLGGRHKSAAKGKGPANSESDEGSADEEEPDAAAFKHRGAGTTSSMHTAATAAFKLPSANAASSIHTGAAASSLHTTAAAAVELPGADTTSSIHTPAATSSMHTAAAAAFEPPSADNTSSIHTARAAAAFELPGADSASSIHAGAAAAFNEDPGAAGAAFELLGADSASSIHAAAAAALNECPGAAAAAFEHLGAEAASSIHAAAAAFEYPGTAAAAFELPSAHDTSCTHPATTTFVFPGAANTCPNAAGGPLTMIDPTTIDIDWDHFDYDSMPPFDASTFTFSADASHAPGLGSSAATGTPPRAATAPATAADTTPAAAAGTAPAAATLAVHAAGSQSVPVPRAVTFGLPTTTPTFVAYRPPGTPLGDRSNTSAMKGSNKRKAPDDGGAQGPAKKIRKPRSDLGTTRGPRVPGTGSTAPTSQAPRRPAKARAPSGAPRGSTGTSQAAKARGRNDSTTERVKQQMAERAAATRASAAVNAQLPPR